MVEEAPACTESFPTLIAAAERKPTTIVEK